MHKRHRKRRFTCKLAVEWLEERCLLSAGDLDLGFGNGGLAAVDFGSNGDKAYAVALDPRTGTPDGGKIVVAGYAFAKSGSDFAVTRLRTDGTPDTTFSNDGKVATSFGTAADEGKDVVVLPDGKVLVAGRANTGWSYDFALIRYTAAGKADGAFGAKGKVTTNFNGSRQSSSFDSAFALALQSDGKAVVAGVTRTTVNPADNNIGLARYTTTGALDPTFGSGGLVTTSFTTLPGNGYTEVRDVAVDSSGRIVVAGTTKQWAGDAFQGHQCFVVRYTAAGVLDTTFGGTGVVSVLAPTNPGHTGGALAVATDGTITAAWAATLIRLRADGTFDTAFDGDGIVALPPAIEGTSVEIQPDGKILVGGFDPNTFAFAAARYTATGSLDLTFSADGIATVPGTSLPTSSENALDVAIQADGKIVLAGGSGGNFTVVRLLGDPALQAASAADHLVPENLDAAAVEPLLAEAMFRWTEFGADTSVLQGIDICIADLGGTTLGLASGSTIRLDANAAGWGWFVDATPWDDSEFTTPGNQGEQNRMDLLTTLAHEIGHLLGYEHAENGVMADTLGLGERYMPDTTSWSVDAAIIEWALANKK
jgi:uncharacterized delta-60 repeat protein